ncbi:unnamed protein product [Parnassius mnemosyne]|uniref:PiggyBac transposable element-derived protein domain-containing protein n=1 Tax=Parnassius mnemosyne TaxID=213953 RepID=A0AAV1LF89_9NEOP
MLALFFACKIKFLFQNLRSKRILALVPQENAQSDISGTSNSENELEDEVYNFQSRASESSEAPSIDSALERLDIDFSDDNYPNTAPTDHTGYDETDNYDDDHQANNFSLTSISSLPTLSPMSNIPSMTPSFIINQVSDSPQQSPCNSTSTPLPNRYTRKRRRQQNSVSKRPCIVTKNKKVNLKFQWSSGRFRFRAELEPDKFENPIPDGKTTLDYFNDFFSEDMFDEICHYTNMYSIQKTGRSINLSGAELRKFIAIKVITGIVSMPSYLDYWATDTRFPLVADVMPLKRYQIIRGYLHFVDNIDTDSDPYFKIRPVVEKIRANCLKVEEETRFSIDEMVIPYKGTKAGKKRQYNPRKPRKWGFKNLVRAGASGIIYDFFLYTGNDNFGDCNFTKEEEGLGWGAKAVLRLCKSIKKKPCVVYFDNFFSSLDLIHHLRNFYGIFSLGTMRTNRLRDAGKYLKPDKVLKTQGRGAFSQTVCNKTKLSVVKWNDNKCVVLASSYADAYPLTKVRRYCKIRKQRIEVQYPNVVMHYNAHMGGVDLSDMLIALYRTEMKTRRWYLSIFSQLLDICIYNAWLTYRRDNKRKGEIKYILLIQFRLSIYKALLKKGTTIDAANVQDLNKINKIKNPTRSRPVDDVRFDNIDHFPEHGKDYGRCAYCKKGFTTVFCMKCNVRLCFVKDRNCHYNYHHRKP